MADVKGLGKTVALGAVEGLGPKLAALTKGIKEAKAEIADLRAQVGTPVAAPTKAAATKAAAPAKAAAKKATASAEPGTCIMGNDPNNCSEATLAKYQGGGCRAQACKDVNAKTFRELRAAKKAREAAEAATPAKAAAAKKVVSIKATPAKVAPVPTKGAAKKVAGSAKKASAR